MLYIDVTSSCKSPMSTGIQRVVRGLFRALGQVTAVTPLVWDPALTSYCTLSKRERAFLETPFGIGGVSGLNAHSPPGDAEPGRRANPVPIWSKFARTIVHRRNRLDLHACLTAEDTLFVPEIFQDNRLASLAGLLRSSPARFVGVCHDALAWRRPDVIPPARQEGFAAYLAGLAQFHHVLAVSNETADDLRACWREAGHEAGHESGRNDTAAPLTVIAWPVDHAGSPRRAVPPPGWTARRSVLCVATFEPRKNHLVLLDAATRAWKRGADFELVLIGRTTAQWGAKVTERIDDLTAAGRPLRWLRHVDDETLRRAYERCAFTVFPSLVEGFGLPILESLWYGRPCICGVNGALGEVSAGGGCLSVDQTNPAALAGAIQDLLANELLYSRLVREAEARVFRSWETLADELLPIVVPGDIARR